MSSEKACLPSPSVLFDLLEHWHSSISPCCSSSPASAVFSVALSTVSLAATATWSSFSVGAANIDSCPIASVPSRSSSSTYLCRVPSCASFSASPSGLKTRQKSQPASYFFSTTSSHFPLRTSSSWSSSSKNSRRSIRSVFVESCLRIFSQYEGSFWETHWSVLPKFLPKVILRAPLSLPCASRLSPPSPISSSPTLGDTSPRSAHARFSDPSVAFSQLCAITSSILSSASSNLAIASATSGPFSTCETNSFCPFATNNSSTTVAHKLAPVHFSTSSSPVFSPVLVLRAFLLSEHRFLLPHPSNSPPCHCSPDTSLLPRTPLPTPASSPPPCSVALPRSSSTNLLRFPQPSDTHPTSSFWSPPSSSSRPGPTGGNPR